MRRFLAWMVVLYAAQWACRTRVMAQTTAHVSQDQTARQRHAAPQHEAGRPNGHPNAPVRPLRWRLSDDGGISWRVRQQDAHTDHIEMAGKQVAIIVTYGTDSLDRLVLKKHLVFPLLRTIPNDTRGSLTQSFSTNIIDAVKVDGQFLEERPFSFYINGCVRTESRTNTPVWIQRTIYPSVDKAAYIEKYRLTNTGPAPVRLDIPAQNGDIKTDPAEGVSGSYIINSRVYHDGTTLLDEGKSYEFSLVISARKASDQPYYYSADYEWERRRDFTLALSQSLVLHTPDDTLNRMFSFAKIRAAESIYDTKNGLLHSPGGGDYYAAIWANDQAEYINPFFPFLGDAAGNESAKNSFRLFAGYTNPAYTPIPSSIVAEGDGTWSGAGDRGDEAMIAYGASRFALAYGDTIEAERLWPLIDWCLTYLRRKETNEGVIASQSDELEGRFPSGKINLSTNVLAYGGFLGASRLAGALGKAVEAAELSREAVRLRGNIEKYFDARVQGFDTYRYYEGNTRLRSWICLPLVMGIFDRKEETIKALFSPYLWTKNGILTESGSDTFWDRATLYAFRGLFYAGATDTSLKYLKNYSATRLLGEHVPYAVEAWPEGDQRHLSAESGLYCRVITEGLFGIEPIGFNRFTLSPRLPKGWNSMSLEHIKAFNNDFDIRVSAAGAKEKVDIVINGKTVKGTLWDKHSPIIISL